jgi:DNA uptake protein ComE-like DNA-binding protein
MSRHKFFREGYPPAPGTDPVTLTRPGDFAFDLNAATFEELSRIPLLGRERARAVIEARPITRWEQLRHLPDFTDTVVKDLRKGGARIRKAA